MPLSVSLDSTFNELKHKYAIEEKTMLYVAVLSHKNS